MSNKVPQIRFNGYSDAWEQCKLSDEMTDFIVPMRDKPKEFGGNIPWTRIEDIEGKFLNDSLSEQYVTEETIQKMNLKIIPKDSLIVSSSATFGVVAVVTQDLITNQTFIGLVPREKNTLDYWYSFFQSSEARKYMKLQSAGSTIFYIARDSFEKMPISVPKIDEMIKIGEYFSNLDNLIALHQRKLDLLKEQKKGYLQKMFPKNGAKVPELRFAGFADDWEQCKLSDEMTDFIVPMRDKPKEFGGNIPWTRIEDIEGKFLNDSLSEQYVTEETIQKMNLKIIPKDSLIVSSSATFGVVAVVTQDLITNQTFIGLVPREKNTLDYWYSFFQSSEARKYMKLQSAGSTIFYIARDSFEKMPISVPKIDEMIKIGEYFSNLDNLIALHQRKLELLKEQKKGFLQKMFV